jgi:hypothetical protein
MKFMKRCVFWFLEHRKIDKVRKHSNSERYTPSSNPLEHIKQLFVYTQVKVGLEYFI